MDSAHNLHPECSGIHNVSRTDTPRSAVAKRIVALCATTLVLFGCSTSGEARYDISPIFPLSTDTCAKYHGEESGEGFGATCLVTKSECERAVADWRQAMSAGGVDDAILFSCD